MVISHVTIIADSELCLKAILGAILGVMQRFFCIINWNNTWTLGNIKFISRVAFSHS